MRRFRDVGLILALFGILIAFTVYGPGRNAPSDEGQRGSTHSKGDEGALGLQLWLRALGYRSENLEYTDWTIPPATDALLMLAPERVAVSDDERDSILAWVRAGGTLILVAERPTANFNPDPLWAGLGAGVTISTTDDLPPAERATASQPLLTNPVVTSVEVQTNLAIS